ncbi:cysteine desulfurase [Vibrio parahaemolyticus VPCR-2010]|nr:cysteine desulfurase [Vibrio parahaemolyticus VPCR-2010]
MNINKRIYLDYAATTPVAPEVIEEMVKHLGHSDNFGNPASRSHDFGWNAEKAIDESRLQIANSLHTDPRSIVWTSGATEANNLAIRGAAQFYQKKGKHIITSKIEHKSVLDICRQLEADGFEVTYIDPDKEGRVTVDRVEEHMRSDTILVSIMFANNEIGTINDIERIGCLTRSKGVIFHVDAVQAYGKLLIDVEKLKIDLLSVSAHKIYGPKGIGALYVGRKPRIRIKPQMLGGGHERGMRSGTLPTHQIAGFALASKIAYERINEDRNKYLRLRYKLLTGIQDIQPIQVNGSSKYYLPNIINISFPFVEGESLLMAIDKFAVSSGSACTSASLEPSYVLRALGLYDEVAHSSIRFSLGRETSDIDVEELIKTIKNAVQRLRELSPLWDMYLDGVDLKSVEWVNH